MVDQAPRPSPLSRGRRWLFGILGFLLVALLAEAAAFFVLWGLYGTPRVWSSLAAARDAAVASAGQTADLDGDIQDQARFRIPKALHPFMGYVTDPGQLPGGWERGMDPTSIDLGFRNEADPSDPPDDAFVVGIFGGSVADILAHDGAEAVREAIGRLPVVAGRRVVVLSGASPGYKQPQQVITLNYLLFLGGRFDAVINVDGFNDIALAQTELEPVGANPYFPRAWYFMTATMDPSRRRLVGAMAIRDEARVATTQRFARPILRWSSLAGVLWSVIDRRDTARLVADEGALLAFENDPGYSAKGPQYSYARGQILDDLVLAWQRGSRQMHHLCAGLGIPYLHVLQPNQYVPNSKPMGDEEREIAMKAQKRYGMIIEKGYPKLLAAGEVLRQEGIAFEDATMIFSDVEAPLYRDSCCHFHRPGSAILAEKVAEALGRLTGPG